MEPKYDILKFRPEDVEAIRKEYNMHTEERREEAFTILEEWLLKQDHLIKKTYSRDYLERCIATCYGSIEKAKLQIDRMCTMRTLFPKYFQISNIKDSEIMLLFNKCYVGYSTRLTKQRYRVFIQKIKPNIQICSEDFERLYKYFTFTAEFLKNNEVAEGIIVVLDCLEANVADMVTKFNLFEFQQKGFGCKVKGIIFLTSSKLIEGFVNLIKSVFKEKMRNRIHVATTQDQIKDFLPDDIEVLPVEYGGNEKPLEELHGDVITTLSSESVQKLLEEMNVARTDESRRQIDKFNDQYMGMAGTFRTIRLD